MRSIPLFLCLVLVPCSTAACTSLSTPVDVAAFQAVADHPEPQPPATTSCPEGTVDCTHPTPLHVATDTGPEALLLMAMFVVSAPFWLLWSLIQEVKQPVPPSYDEMPSTTCG